MGADFNRDDYGLPDPVRPVDDQALLEVEASFQKAMESLEFEDKIAGTTVSYGPDDHQGADAVIISKIVGDNWQEVARK